jgi:hypothetical protein
VDRADLETGGAHLLNAGRWANADVLRLERAGETWIVKDFRHCPWLVRATWGRWMVARELHALTRLDGIVGIPSGARRIDRFAFTYRFIEGPTLRHADRRRVPVEYFLRLEELVRRMHAAGIAHLDLRNRRNALVTAEGLPAILDFQSAVRIESWPSFLRPLLRQVDLSGVYKHWASFHPGTMGAEREALLARHEAIRRFWIFRGYLGIKRARGERVAPAGGREARAGR